MSNLMMKFKKISMLLIFALSTLFYVLPSIAFAAEPFQEDSFEERNLDSNGIGFSFDFSVPEGEQSRVYLTKLFGNMPGALSCEEITCGFLVPSIFNILNLGIMTIGAGVLAYVIAMTTALSAVEGEFLGKRYSSFWLPIRSAVGVSILVPGPSGYSILQVMLMNLILYGVGLANNIYQTIDTYGQLFSISTDKSSGSAQDFEVISDRDINMIVMNSFPAFLAVIHENELLYQETGDFEQSLLINTSYMNRYLTVDVNSRSVKYLINSRPTGPSSTNVSFRINSSNLKGADLAQLLGTNPQDIASGSGVLGLIFSAAVEYYKQELQEFIQINRLTNDNQDKIVENLSFESLEIIAQALKLQSQNYSLRGATTGELDQTISWLNVPGRFHKWLSDSQDGDLSTLSKITFEPTQVVIDQSFGVQNTNITNLVDLQSSPDYKDLLKKIVQKIADEKTFLAPQAQELSTQRFYGNYDKLRDRAPGTHSILIDNLIVRPSENQDPLLYLAEQGKGIIEVYTGVTIAISIASLGFVLGTAVCSGIQSVGKYSTVYSFFTLFLSIMQLFAIVLPIGITLAFYLPLMPIMIYSLSVLAWFMQVVEAMVAAPIITLGLLAPSQEGMGKAAPSLLLTLNIVLRPAFMLIGLVMGAKLFAIFAVYFTEVMSSAILFVEKLFATGGSFFLIFLGWVWALMYVSVIVSIAQRCYSLTYVLPDRVLTWIGGQAVDTGREISSDLQQVQQASDKGAQAVTQLGTLPQKALNNFREFGRAAAAKEASRGSGNASDNSGGTSDNSGGTSDNSGGENTNSSSSSTASAPSAIPGNSSQPGGVSPGEGSPGGVSQDGGSQGGSSQDGGSQGGSS